MTHTNLEMPASPPNPSSALNALLLVTALSLVLGACATREPAASHHVEAYFQLHDSDSDQQVTRHEIAAVYHDRILSQADSNQDDYLSLEELTSAMPAGSDAAELFNHLDKDSDDRIAPKEAIEFVADHVHYSKDFGNFDTNQDDVLHFEEFAEAEPSLWSLNIVSLPLN